MVVPGRRTGGESKVWDEILEGVLCPCVQRGFLYRTKEVEKSTSPEGGRDKGLHKSTIVVDNPELVRGKTVLIVDDVWIMVPLCPLAMNWFGRLNLLLCLLQQ